MPLGESLSDDQHCTLRALIEDIAFRTEDLGWRLEDLQGLAEGIALGSRTGIDPATLVRLQVLDSLTQRLFVLPELLRCLKAAVPEDLAMTDAEIHRSFAAMLSSYQGTATSDQPDRPDTSGDCELWNS